MTAASAARREAKSRLGTDPEQRRVSAGTQNEGRETHVLDDGKH